MANKAGIASLGPYSLRVQAGQLFLPNDVAQKIENMYPTTEGSLRTVVGPAALVDDTDDRRPVATSAANPATPSYYKRQHGIFHCRLNSNQRDILLLHTGDELWEFTGWQRGWRRLLSSSPDAIGRVDTLPNTKQPTFPTQFEATGNGIVIVPQDHRAYFYDGYRITPLGFDRRPSPPQSRGPENSATKQQNTGYGVNDIGYAHDNTKYGQSRTNYRAGKTAGFKSTGLGTVSPLTYDAAVFDKSSDVIDNAGRLNAGWLLRGEYKCRVQFIDCFGNLSPLSDPSASIDFDLQSSVLPKDSTSENHAILTSSTRLLKQVAWAGIPIGPDYCIGRNLYRSKDLVNSGTAQYFKLSQNAASVATSYATLTDNTTKVFPDSIPDSDLRVPAQEVDAVPLFRLCRVAFGRLWVANIKDQPGLLRPSLPGRWGTFPADTEFYPDPSGGEITGLASTPRGLLAFTRTSTYLIENSGEDTFTTSPLSADIGCVAPSSIATLGDGTTIWLGTNGFYSYNGTNIQNISESIDKTLRRTTKGRLEQAAAAYDVNSREYRCWVSLDGNVRNNFCFVFNGTGWRVRTDVTASAVCVTKDHRHLMLTAGTPIGEPNNGRADEVDVGHEGVYVLDRSGNHAESWSSTYTNTGLPVTPLQTIVAKREAIVETNWIQGAASKQRRTAQVIYLWLRETADTNLTVEVMRDWRNAVVETAKARRVSDEDVPAIWGKTKFGTSKEVYGQRRPFWSRVQVYVPSNETFKFRVKGDGFWEFVGMSVDVAPKHYGGAQLPP